MRIAQTLLLALLALLASVGAHAQDLPAEVVNVLREECAKYPGPVTDEHVFGNVLNATAWRTRHLGMGLSRKTGGKRVPSPVGEVAEDVLQDCNTGHHWDVFAGAELGRPLVCGGGASIGIMQDPNRPCVRPVEPSGGSAPAPDPGPSPTPPAPAPAPGIDYRAEMAALTAAVAALRSDVAVLRAEAAGIRSEAGNAHESLYRLIAETVVAVHLDDIKARVDRVEQAIANMPKPSPIRLPWEE